MPFLRFFCPYILQPVHTICLLCRGCCRIGSSFSSIRVCVRISVCLSLLRCRSITLIGQSIIVSDVVDTSSGAQCYLWLSSQQLGQRSESWLGVSIWTTAFSAASVFFFSSLFFSFSSFVSFFLEGNLFAGWISVVTWVAVFFLTVHKPATKNKGERQNCHQANPQRTITNRSKNSFHFDPPLLLLIRYSQLEHSIYFSFYIDVGPALRICVQRIHGQFAHYPQGKLPLLIQVETDHPVNRSATFRSHRQSRPALLLFRLRLERNTFSIRSAWAWNIVDTNGWPFCDFQITDGQWQMEHSRHWPPIKGTPLVATVADAQFS